jgi:hypothetical protein
VVRVAQSLVFCVIFCVLDPGFHSGVRVVLSLVFCVVLPTLKYVFNRKILYEMYSDCLCKTINLLNTKMHRFFI